MSLDIDIEVSLGDFVLVAKLHAPAGEVTAVLGPNGAGKSTLLGCVAGERVVDHGEISLDGGLLDRAPDVFVVPEKRSIGVVHQDHLLFPHMNALDNVAFGPRQQGVRRGEARRAARDLLERVGVGDLAQSRPRALSGGQAQRVALARALACDPDALLLDEPLAALDARSRMEVRRDLHRHLSNFDGPTLLVTHDPVDALVMADHVVVLEAGRVAQAGPISEVTSRPRSRYVADLIGTNLISGSATGTALTTSNGTRIVAAEAFSGPVFAVIAPTAVAVHERSPEGSARNRWEVSVQHVERLGERVRVHTEGPVDLVAEITPESAAGLNLVEGRSVWVSVKATEIEVYPS